MKVICDKGADFIYTDEATFESPELHKIIHTNFKPDFAPDYFHGCNYICHFTSFKRTLLESSGGAFNSECDGSQDYDLFLRLTEHAQKICHIAKCLYFWRSSSSSVAEGTGAKPYTMKAGKHALENHFKRCGQEAEIDFAKVNNTYRVKYKIKEKPLVSIIIPSYDHWKTLKRCIDSIETLSTYKNYEIIIIENNSKLKKIFDYYKSLESDEKEKVVTWPGRFNYAAINNFGFTYARGGIILLNNDTQVITPGWIEEMLMFAQRKDVGAVGAMLYFPSGKIQHAGVILGLHGLAGHACYKAFKDTICYCYRNVLAMNCSAVTAACMMMSRTVYEQVKGFDESLKVDFNDVDLCMRIRKAGYLIVWTPFAELYHSESESCGQKDTLEKVKRSQIETEIFKERWKKELLAGDPYYNPNLSVSFDDFSTKDGAVFPVL